MQNKAPNCGGGIWLPAFFTAIKARFCKQFMICRTTQCTWTIFTCASLGTFWFVCTTEFSNGFCPLDFAIYITTRNIKKFTRRQCVQTTARFILFGRWGCLLDNVHGIKFIAACYMHFAIFVMVHFDRI